MVKLLKSIKEIIKFRRGVKIDKSIIGKANGKYSLYLYGSGFYTDFGLFILVFHDYYICSPVVDVSPGFFWLDFCYVYYVFRKWHF